MSRVLKFILAGIGSLAAVVVLLVVVALLIPDDTYRGWLTEAVSSATGRALQVDGEFRIDAGSHLKVQASEVRFANAEWASEPSMVTLGRVDADVRLLSLFRGVVEVTFDVESPKVFLETDASGRGNWEMGDSTATADPDPDPDRSPEPLVPSGLAIAPSVRILEGEFRFLQGESGRTEQFDLSRFELGVPDARLSADLEGQYRGQAVTLSADFGGVEQMLAGDVTDVQLDAAVGEIALSVSGSWSRLLDSAGPTADLLLTLGAPSTSSFDPLAGASLPELGAVAFNGRVGGGAGQFAAEEIELLIEGPNMQAGIVGRVGDLVAVQDMAFKVELASDAVPAIVDAFGLDLPGTVPKSLEASGEIGGGIDRLALKDFTARSSEGEVIAEVSGSAEDLLSRQGVVADLTFTAPSLAALSKYAGRELPESGGIRAESHLASTGQTYEISRIDLKIEGDDLNGDLTGSVEDLLALSGVNLALDAQIGSLANFSELAGVEMPETAPLKVKADVVASEGVQGPAKISTNLESDWLRGKVEATVDDVLTGEGVDAALDLELQSLAVLSGFAGRELPPMGPVKASGRLASVGESYTLTDLDIGAEDEALKARITGSIGDILAVSGIDVALDAQVGSLSNFSKIAGTDLPVTKPLSIKATAVASEGAEGSAKLSADIESDWLSGKVQATVADLQAVRGVGGDVSFTLQSLADLSSIAGQDLPPMGPVKASATLASEGESVAVQKLNVAMEDPAVRANLTGSVDDALALKGIKLALEAAVDSVSSLSSLAGQQLPETPPVNMTAQVTASAGIQGPVKVVADVESDQVRLNVQGTIADLSKTNETRFDLSLDAASLAALGKLAGTPLGDIGPVAATTTLGTSSQEVDLVSLDMRVGKSDLSGDLKFVLPNEGAKGNVTGLFTSTLLDVEELAGAGGTSPAPIPAADENQTASSGDRVFPNDPLPLEALSLYDAFIELSAQRVQFPNVTAENGQLTLRLDDGDLRVDLTRAEVEGRPIGGSLMLDSVKRPSPVALKLKADKVSLSHLLQENAYLQGGQLYVDVDVRGAGNSVREIMAGLDGHLSVAVRDTRLSSSALAFMGKDILSQINPLTASEGYSELECTAFVFDIDKGLATTPRGLISRETSATWVGNGEINLKDETLNFTFESKPRKGLGFSAGKLASLVQLSGTLATPTVTPDPVGVAKTSAETALAFMTAGTSLLATRLFDKATSSDEVCEEILRLVVLGKDPGAGADESGDKESPE